MSLLMDALRRAEQEKQQQRERAAEARDSAIDQPSRASEAAPRPRPAIGSEDATVQVERAAIERASAAFGVAATTLPHAPAAAPSGVPTEPHDDSGDLSQSGTYSAVPDFETPAGPAVVGSGARLALEPLEPDEGADPPRPPRGLGDADRTSGTTFNAHPDAHETTTMPSSRAVERNLNAYFDRSQSVDMPRGAARGDFTLEDVAAHTVVNAETVFTAGERPRSRPLLLGVAILAVLIVIGIGLAAALYARKSPGPRHMPPPTVAVGVERPAQSDLPLVALAPPADLATIEPARLDTTPPPTAGVPTDVAATPANPASTPIATPAELAPTPVATAALPVQPAAPTARPRAPIPDPAPTAPAQRPVGDVGVGELRIARSARASAIDDDVASGYAAFQMGDLARAEDDYRKALRKRPEHRDALLGLGAIALARGDYEGAYGYYVAVLKSNPDDSVASTAVFNLTGGRADAGAARLRILRDADDSPPYVHFALGNWYARQGRWPDAQQAYFDAVRRAPENADYAYNLAVSLDHMGQARAAREHYQLSLELAERNPGAFDSAQVLERIGALAGAAGAPEPSP